MQDRSKPCAIEPHRGEFREQVKVHLLANPLEYPLAARTLDANCDAWILALENFRPLFGNHQIHRRVPIDLALAAGGVNECRRDANSRWRRRKHTRCPGGE